MYADSNRAECEPVRRAAVLDALRNAASALLTTAPEAIVKRMLRELLADGAPAAPFPNARSSLRSASPPRPGRKRAARRAAANGIDAEWEQLRNQVREAMRERGTSYTELAAAIGRSAATTKINVSRHLPASGPVQAALRAWLAQAPEVAAPALPFRAGRGNGSREDAAVTRVHT